MPEYHLAQINIARMKGVNIDDPIMIEFVNNLNTVNKAAESSEGFVWRLKDDTNNATNINPYNDEQVIVNISVWLDVKSLEQFMYKTVHSEFLRRRREWFHAFGQATTAIWWIEKGIIPAIADAVARLDHIQRHGPSAFAFEFKTRFDPPVSIQDGDS